MAVGLYLSVQECLQEELLDSAAECLIRQVGGQQRGAVRRPVTAKPSRVRCWKQAQSPSKRSQTWGSQPKPEAGNFVMDLGRGGVRTHMAKAARPPTRMCGRLSLTRHPRPEAYAGAGARAWTRE